MANGTNSCTVKVGVASMYWTGVTYHNPTDQAQVFEVTTCHSNTSFDTTLHVYEVLPSVNGSNVTCRHLIYNDDAEDALHQPAPCSASSASLLANLASAGMHVVQPHATLVIQVAPFSTTATGDAVVTLRLVDDYTCNACPANTYKNDDGAGQCKSCAAGQYLDGSSTSGSCTGCVPGQYSHAGQSSCQTCPSSSYTDTANSTGCTAWAHCNATTEYLSGASLVLPGTCKTLRVCDATCGITLDTEPPPQYYLATSSVVTSDSTTGARWAAQGHHFQMNQCKSNYSILNTSTVLNPNSSYIDWWNGNRLATLGAYMTAGNWVDGYDYAFDLGNGNATKHTASGVNTPIAIVTLAHVDWTLTYTVMSGHVKAHTVMYGTANAALGGGCFLNVSQRETGEPAYWSGTTELVAYYSPLACNEMPNNTTLVPVRWKHLYESKAPTQTSNRECSPAWSNCLPGQYMVAEATATSNRVCASWSTCTSQQHQVSAGNATHDTECRDWTQCQSPEYQNDVAEGTYETAAPTATSDRVCASCTVCTESQFASSVCHPGNDTVCTPVSPSCSSLNEYTLLVETLTSDRVCQNATLCSATEYESVPKTNATDRNCTKLTTCPVETTYIAALATPTSDRVCKPLVRCSKKDGGNWIEEADEGYVKSVDANTRQIKCINCANLSSLPATSNTSIICKGLKDDIPGYWFNYRTEQPQKCSVPGPHQQVKTPCSMYDDAKLEKKEHSHPISSTVKAIGYSVGGAMLLFFGFVAAKHIQQRARDRADGQNTVLTADDQNAVHSEGALHPRLPRGGNRALSNRYTPVSASQIHMV